jgi:hypothetical protein
MKARIEKKISKRLANEFPDLFRDAWQGCHEEPSELAYEQGSCVSGLMYVGGGVDYWGEGQDAYSCYEWLMSNYEWILGFEPYPDGHEFEGLPNTEGFKPTAINLLGKLRAIK